MRRRLLAVAAVVTAAAGGFVATPEKHLRIEATDGGCVIPDCRTYLGRGAWDDNHTEVDCHFVGPYSQDGGPVWRGCSVGAAQYAVGSECLPVQCSVIAGEDPTAYH